MLAYQIKDNIDILLISETKLDERFLSGQFLLNGFSTLFRQDRTTNGGEISLYIMEDIPAFFYHE